ncbi:hypothetical protein GJU40_01630 [Bacillus lacus]|uniref:Uncharacterized protein n=1 Tax=Metabacillus lacus TaxID=1983721 RepID=A0A7X2LYH0_9BACI|nr:hypothetical protein [Metabacillus lacus]MRX70867.1 hypothetical protein [Metabacillus lacus]
MKRPKVSQTVIDEFSRIVDLQDQKGFEKYGVSIDDAQDENYSWELMALEETADLQKYLVKRIQQLTKQNRELRLGQRRILMNKLMNENLRLEQQNKELAAERNKYKQAYNALRDKIIHQLNITSDSLK